MFYATLCCLILGCCGTIRAQKETAPSQKGKWYAMWGWNRDTYTQSNIRFWGSQYDFELHGVDAHDYQSKFGLDPYFHPTRFTIPQTNARLGYFFRPQYSISIGLDHMKYVMEQEQSVEITGAISGTNTYYDRTYDHEYIFTSKAFLTFEHTDGLNYINTELRRHAPIVSVHQTKWLSLDLETFSGFGAGILLPKTNCRMFGAERHDDFHLSGYGAHVLTGLGLTFWNHFVIMPEFKAGYINMPDIRTTKYSSDRASQHFWFGEFNLMFGGSFRLWKS
jgi:hypothetical protein